MIISITYCIFHNPCMREDHLITCITMTNHDGTESWSHLDTICFCHHKFHGIYRTHHIDASYGSSWYDDVNKWKYFPRYWPFVRGIHRSQWIPSTKASDAGLSCFLWSAPDTVCFCHHKFHGIYRSHHIGTSHGISWHDDVVKWKHFPRYWPFVRGINRSWWIPSTKASDAELSCFLWSAPEWTVELTIMRLVIWYAIAPIVTSL